MTKWGPVFLGFILAVIVKSFFAHYEFIGLLLVGFIVGYLCRDGAISGMWNAAVAGADRNASHDHGCDHEQDQLKIIIDQSVLFLR